MGGALASGNYAAVKPTALMIGGPSIVEKAERRRETTSMRSKDRRHPGSQDMLPCNGSVEERLDIVVLMKLN